MQTVINLFTVFSLVVFIAISCLVSWRSATRLFSGVILAFLWRVPASSFVFAVGFICTTTPFSILKYQQVSKTYTERPLSLLSLRGR